MGGYSHRKAQQTSKAIWQSKWRRTAGTCDHQGTTEEYAHLHQQPTQRRKGGQSKNLSHRDQGTEGSIGLALDSTSARWTRLRGSRLGRTRKWGLCTTSVAIEIAAGGAGGSRGGAEWLHRRRVARLCQVVEWPGLITNLDE